MLEYDMYHEYKVAQESRVHVSFKGAIAQDVLAELGAWIRASLGSDKESNVKKIFAVFIELSQNVLHYSAERITNRDGKDNGVGLMNIYEKGDKYFINSGNLALNEGVSRILEKIEHVNSLSQDELKVYYQKQLRMPRPDGSKGAGIGFTEIARKVNGPIKYHVDKINDTTSFLTISVCFNKET
ncbi:MAG: SiaB family protein kinase [Leptospira sp.]|nr:SiaB family protein kinase [Leptospira sp.]